MMTFWEKILWGIIILLVCIIAGVPLLIIWFGLTQAIWHDVLTNYYKNWG